MRRLCIHYGLFSNTKQLSDITVSQQHQDKAAVVAVNTNCCGESALSLAEGFKVLHFSLGTYEQGHSLVHLLRAHIQHALRAGGALAASLSLHYNQPQ